MPTKENILNCLIYIKTDKYWKVEEKGNIFHITSSDKNYNFDIYIVTEYDDFTIDGSSETFKDKELYRCLESRIK